MEHSYTIWVDCSDDKGLIYKISSVLVQQSLNIIKNREFVDAASNHFYMRTQVQGNANADRIKTGLMEVLPADSRIQIIPDQKKRIVVLATKESHCLGDLMMRNHFNEWNANIDAVISNYNILRDFTERFNIPYHCVEATENRVAHELAIADIIDSYNPDYVVLARYMRILSADFVERFKGKVINIHHSFLPAFIGAQPYKQAFERGVKIIGATAHFVTEVLDEGPIYCQNVLPVDHSLSAADMAKAGKDVEKMVLAQALQWVFEDRVIVNGNRTIIL